MVRFRFSVAGVIVILGCCGTLLVADDVTYFRHDNGIAADSSTLTADFGVESNLVWRVPLNSGISSPCVHGDRIFVTTFDKESRELATVALNRATGATLWTRVVPAERIEEVHQVGSPASCTPACDGKRVYSFFGSYGLLCHDIDGQLLWKRQLGPFQDEFGASSSPILVDDLLILNQDHDVDCVLMAFDKLTGKTRWQIPRDGFTRSYSSPILVETADDRSLVVAGALKLVAYDIKTGTLKWWVNGLSRIVDPTPVYAEGLVYIATWTPGGDPSSRIAMQPYDEALTTYDNNQDGLIAKSELSEGPVLQRFFRIDLDQDEKLSRLEWGKHGRVFELAQNAATAVRPGGTGDITESNVAWTYRRGLPTVPSSVVYRGVMYMVKDSGIITTLDAATGELIKQGRARGPGNYYASLVAGDGKVYLISERGVITVLTADRDWSILSSHDLGERVLATPAVQDGRIYLRTDEAMYCFSKP
ncbi:MAG: PQQ-binding-like beta-propeller repeat protein [Fuerstiella sp.]|nr:PQQ-binding-like beta-propeller repeat protein [Fuerstiella sp.]